MTAAREAGAAAWLRRHLADGQWHLVSDLKRDAAADGIARAALPAGRNVT